MEPSTTPEIWYQQGNWPLLGAVVVLLITNVIALWKILFQAKNSVDTQLRFKRIEFISQQLSEFYNPIYAMMSANGHIFANFAPQTFPDDEILRQTAGENWKLLKDRVILPNNDSMAEILREKSHLLSQKDDISHYLDLNNHLNMYAIFSKNPTELYKGYQFPEGIRNHVQINRLELVRELNNLKKT
jgi:hypothetical protein